MSNDKVFQQDLKNQENPPGTVFIMHILFNERCNLPEKETMQSIMEKHLGETYCFSYDEKMAGFAPNKYKKKISTRIILKKKIKTFPLSL